MVKYVCIICSSIWQSFPFFFLCLPFSIDFPSFYRQSSHIHRAFSTSIILGQSRALIGSNYQTWVNVERRVLPGSLGRGKIVALLRDRAFFLNDKLMEGTSLWSYSFMVCCYVLHEEDIIRNLFIPFSREDSSPGRK